MGGHPIGEGLDQRRSVTGTGTVEHRGRHGIRGKNVVAVDPDAREAEAVGALVDRGAGLAGVGLGDGPLVVLAEEDDRAVVDAGEDERLVVVALRGRAVAHAGDDGGVARVVARADGTVALDAHGVAGAQQALVADDDGVAVEAELGRVPGALVDTAVHRDEAHRVEAAGPGEAVLAVAGEGVVLLAHRAAGADLGGFLAEERGPQAELTLTLERGRLEVEAADEDEVAIETAQVVVAQGVDDLVVLRMGNALTLRGEELDHVGAAIGGRAGFYCCGIH